MKTSTELIRYLVIAQLLAGIAGLSLDLALESSLPPPLQEFLRSDDAVSWEILDYFVAAWSAAFLVASLGLILSRQWARGPYVVTSIGNLLFVPFGPVAVVASSAALFYQASILANGAALGIILFQAYGGAASGGGDRHR